MLRFIGRLILIPLGIILAAVTAGAFLVSVGFVQPSVGGALTDAAIGAVRTVIQGVMESSPSVERYADLALGLARLTFAILFLPVVLVAAVAEVFGMRIWLLQALVAALLTALLPWAMTPELIAGQPLASPVTALLAATGALAGSIYWMVSGRNAGPEPKSVEERATVKAPAIRR
jgi:hypothetical protein